MERHANILPSQLEENDLQKSASSICENCTQNPENQNFKSCREAGIDCMIEMKAVNTFLLGSPLLGDLALRKPKES